MFKDAFMRESRQKAWGAICNAEWIRALVESGNANYKGMEAAVEKLKGEIDASERAIDYHTVEQREKRKSLQMQVNELVNKAMPQLAENLTKLAQRNRNLLAQADENLALEAHAKDFAVKDAPENETTNTQTP